MASASGIANIEKLTEDNYELWKVQMKSVLVFNELWQYVNGTEIKTSDNVQEWTKKDAKALALINLSITHGQLNHVKKAKTSQEAWTGLKEIFESHGPVRKAALYKQLLRMEKKANVSITQYVNDFTTKAEQLEEAGIMIPDELLSIMLLSSLPADYENFSIAIESRDDIPSLGILKVKLKEEEARQNERNVKINERETNDNALLTNFDRQSRIKSVNQNSNSYRQSSRKFIKKCFNCGKPGHKSRYCRLKPKRESNNADAIMTAIACSAELVKKSGIWCLDSGATRHMCNNRQSFTELNESDQSKVYTATEHHVKSVGIGNVKLITKVNRYTTKWVTLQNVLYVPELRNNLLSVSSITDKGYTILFTKNHAKVQDKGGSVMLTATKRNELYVVNENEEDAMCANKIEDNNLVKWHQRYGHLNVNDLKKMKDKEMVFGLDFKTKTTEINCEICAKCKIHAQPFKQSSSREKEILGLVHSDICGPMNNESVGGARYFVTFIDDCTRYTDVVMLRNRSDVFQAFKNYKQKVEKQTEHKIKKLRTDNGKEYLSKEFKKLLEEEGIIHQLSVEYTPQQNGVAERANRTIVEMARCMMVQANLPNSLWAEMVNTATYLRNRCATKSLNEQTPFEAWMKHKPHVSFFRTIGSKAIVLNKRYRRGKFQAKGDEYILVGYSEESKAYRLWQPGTKKIIKARDIKFIEKMDSNQIGEMFVPELVRISKEEVKEESRKIYIPEEKEENEENKGNEENQEDVQDESNLDESEQEMFGESQHGVGRPKLLRTGKRGRPRKMYNVRSQNNTQNIQLQEVMEKEDSEL